MAKTALFRVGVRTDQSKPPVEHLVRATSKQQAIEACTRGMVSAEVAEPEDIYRLAKAGVPITDATAPAAQAAADPAAPAKKQAK
jgi:hypothetical protein